MLKTPIRSPIINPVKPFFRGKDEGLLWTPTQLGVKNICWLDFVDLNYITLASGKIASMTDKSDNARVFAQLSAGNRPTYGVNGATFLRTLDYLVHEGAFIANNAGGFTISATVINETESAGSDGVLISESTFNANSRPYFSFIVKRTDGTIRNRIGAIYINSSGSSGGLTGTTTTSDIPSLSLTEYNLVSMEDDGSTYRNFTNTVQSDETVYARTGTLTGTNRTVIGALLNNTTFGSTFGFTVYDILVTSNDLTTDELNRKDAYMLWNCGQQAKLPNNHPYKYQPPYV